VRIPDSILQTIVFIGRPNRVGELVRADLVGTGFLVSVPIAGTDLGFVYLVTARHVAAAFPNDEFAMCYNRRDGTGGMLGFQPPHRWYFHPNDSSVDVAVMQLDSMLLELGVMWLPLNSLKTTEEFVALGIGPGDEIKAIGLMANFPGLSKIQPAVRSGNFSMFPADRVRTTHFGNIKAYIVEMRAQSGISGAPIFVTETIGVQTAIGKPLYGNSETYMLGIVHGHWDEIAKEGSVQNANMAVVVPSEQVLEIINQPELVALRQAAIP
jgi:hypothetical protein